MKIIIGAGVSSLSPQQVEDSLVFKNWADRLSPDWRGEVTVNAVDVKGGEIHMLQVTVASEGDPWPEPITLRSETVDILAIVSDGIQRWVVFVKQKRVAAGGIVISNPAGGLGWSETPAAGAKRELREELGLNDINTEFKVGPFRFITPIPVLASPGITNERTYMMQVVIQVESRNLETLLDELHDKETGVTAEGEAITLTVVPFAKAMNFITSQPDPDSKTVESLALAALSINEE